MASLKSIKKVVIKALDWHELIDASFPEWFHDYVEEELLQISANYGNDTTTVFPGYQALEVFESACLVIEDHDDVGDDDVQFIRDCIGKARTTYDLDNLETRIVVRS